MFLTDNLFISTIGLHILIAVLINMQTFRYWFVQYSIYLETSMFVLSTYLAITIIVGRYRFQCQRQRNRLISLILVDLARGGFKTNTKTICQLNIKT